MLIGTHSHLFLKKFSDDLPQMMERACQTGVSRIYMSSIDNTTIEPMLPVCADYPDFCYPMIGLHPTSVNESYRQELSVVRKRLEAPSNFVAIGEAGSDLYWDKTFLSKQLYVFGKQIEWAFEYKLPIVIRSRETFDCIYKVMEPYKNTALTSIFHSFTGNAEEAARLLESSGFILGINGVVTSKRSLPPGTLLTVPLERIILGTGSPYLTPTPNRGKGNENVNVYDAFLKLVEAYRTTPEHLSQATSENALKMFGMVK